MKKSLLQSYRFKIKSLLKQISLFVLFLILSIVFAQAQVTDTYTASGTWLCPPGVVSVTVECWGGGGAGGGTSANSQDGGGGGAGGTYVQKVVAVVPGNTYTVTVGKGGAGANSAGVTGGASWFSTAGTVYAQGGAGGDAPNGGTANGGLGSITLSIGTIRYAGGNGANGNNTLSGGGGGGAGTTGAGGNASGTTGGTGTTLWGGDGANGRVNENDGRDGLTFGGGGSGAFVPDNTNHAGGSGADGQVLITYTPVAGAFDGTFSSGTNFPANGMVVVNGVTNKWYVGTATHNGAPNCAYISSNSGTSNTYSISTASVSHFYFDYTFPALQTCITLTFDWKAYGESCCDYIRVYGVPTTTTPVAGTDLASGLLGGPYNLQSTWQTVSITLPAAWAGTTKRIVFSWRNDGSLGTDPPGAIDNISIVTSAVAVPGCATYTAPSNGATGVCYTPVTLTWNAVAPVCGNPVTYDVYFNAGATATALVSSSQVGTTWLSGALLAGTQYSWKIVPRTSGGPAVGCGTWSFTTATSLTANCAIYNSPANGASGIVCGIDAILNWSPNGPSCDPPSSYDVYFGTNPVPPFVVNQPGTMYNPGVLSPSTTYYWKIIPRNTTGPAVGCVTRSFTTGATYSPAQTTPPITETFENCNEWVMVNGAQPNKWIRGTATANTGSYSMYINNTGTNNDYNISALSVVHFYKDITFPVGNSEYALKFYWKGMGESASFDYLRVYFAPTSVIPVAGTQVNSSYALTPYVYNQSSTWEYFSNTLPVSCTGNETWRLIFSWYNDGSVGTQPPIAIDDIMVTISPRVGTTCANPVIATLPYFKTGETTNCMGDDYTNASISSCGSSYESGNDKVYKVLVGRSGCMPISLTNCSSSSIGIQVYNGCPDVAGTTCIFSSTAGASGGTLSTDVTIPSAGYYYFIVDNWAAPTSVNYDIYLGKPGNSIANDPVCGAIDLTLGISANGDNSCTDAVGEAPAPACWTTGNMNTVWYRVLIPASRDLAIKTTAGSLIGTQIDVYRGDDCNALTYVDCNQDAPSCGTTYTNSYIYLNNIGPGNYAYIRVDGENNTVGSFSIIAIDGNNGNPIWPPLVGQDCGAAPGASNPLCGRTTTIENPGYFGYGNICDFNGTGMCLASGERSSIWYAINITGNGNLEFDIIPNDYGNPNPITGQINPGYLSVGDETDYDWAIWKWEPTCDGLGDNTFCCAEIATGTWPPTSCNYNFLGVTGLYGAADGTNNPAYPAGFAPAYMKRIAVLTGEIYMLVITNFSNDYVSGFSIQFSATSPVGYATPGGTLIWNSSTSNAWNQPGNWGGCSAPTCLLNATINPGGAQPVLIADGAVKDLLINAGATLTISAGVTLTVCGNFTNLGNLVMDPTATLLFNNGSVAQTLNGNLTSANKLGGLTINKTGGSVTANVNMDIGGNFTTSNATSIFDANNRTIKFGGNFSTAAAATLSNCPNIEFNGTGGQTYSNSSGVLSFTNVLMNNSGGGITLTGGATSNLNVNGTLTLTNGIIYTANPPLLVMNIGSAITAGSSMSFVDGPMQKIGNTAFVFPVGDAFNRIMPIGITAPTVSSTFQAQYFYTAYSNTTSMAVAPLPVLLNVSRNEYWMLNRVAGTGNASVTLNWTNAASSGIISCAPLQGGDLTVARWNGTGWENRSNAIIGGITGSCVGTNAGSVTSDPLTAFSPFTFGSKSGTNPLPEWKTFWNG
jgi:hypothetical protein